MASIESISMLNTDGGKALLAEKYGGAIRNEFGTRVSNEFRYDNLSGNPQAGTLIVKKYALSTVGKIGDARKAGKGEALKEKEIVLALDNSWEIVNEVNEADAMTCGVEGLVDIKAADNTELAADEVELEFWAKVIEGGTEVTPVGTTVADQVDEAVVAAETTKSQFVRGYSRDKLGVVLSPAAYSAMQNKIDTIVNPAGGNTYKYYHGVRVFYSTHLPDDVGIAVAPLKKAAAQAVLPLTPLCGLVPLSNDIFFGTAGKYGTVVVYDELVKYVKTTTTINAE